MWESDKKTRKRDIQAGDHKDARKRQDSMTDKHETQVVKRVHNRPEPKRNFLSVKIILAFMFLKSK